MCDRIYPHPQAVRMAHRPSDRYPANWAEISHAIRFERAGGRCECTGQCGSTRHTGPDRCPAVHGLAHPLTGAKVVITTAHLDQTPENCDEENLMAMCQLCHTNYDWDQHRESRKQTWDRRWGRW